MQCEENVPYAGDARNSSVLSSRVTPSTLSRATSDSASKSKLLRSNAASCKASESECFTASSIAAKMLSSVMIQLVRTGRTL